MVRIEIYGREVSCVSFVLGSGWPSVFVSLPDGDAFLNQFRG